MTDQPKQESSSNRQILHALLLLGILTLAEGVLALIVVIREPSELQAQVFLEYSARRWAIILVHFALLIGVGSITWGIWRGGAFSRWVVRVGDNQVFQKGLFYFISILFAATLVIVIRQPGIANLKSYSTLLRPYIVWMFLSGIQFWVALWLRLRGKLQISLRAYIPQNQTTDSYPLGSREKIIFLTVALVYILLQVKSFLDIGSVAITADGHDYVTIPLQLGLRLTDFFSWAGTKPWVTIFFYGLFGYSVKWVDLFQTVFSALGWLFLAWTVAPIFQKQWLKVLAFASILGFSLTKPVQAWNHVALSESISITMMVMILALAISIVQRWRAYKLVMLCLLFFLWANTRETNLYIGLLLAIGLFVLGLFYANTRYTWTIGITVALAFLIQYQLGDQQAQPRWVIPVGNVVTKRILPEPEYRFFFEAQGMPISAEVMSFSGQWIYSHDLAFFNDPKLRDFQKWFYRRGRSVYLDFMLRHPAYTILSPLENIRLLLAPIDDLKNPDNANYDYQQALPYLIGELLFPLDCFWVYLALSIPGLVWMLVSIPWKPKPTSLVILIFLALSLPHLYLSWLGDAADVGRHAIQANIQFRLSILLLFFYFLETINFSKLNGFSSKLRKGNV